MSNRRFLLAAALSLAVAVPAFAETPRASRTTTVSAAGLDLGTEAGQAALAERVSRAVRQVCTRTDDRGAAVQSDMLDCRAEAMAAARPRLKAMIAQARSATQLAMRTR